LGAHCDGHFRQVDADVSFTVHGSAGALMRKTIAVVVAACACVALGAWFLGSRRADRLAVSSRALGETRHILVHLPTGYDASTRTYPLLVLLDGGDQRQYSSERPLYSRSVAVAGALEKEGLPPLVLVGVENRNRVRDMTPVERPDLYVGGGGSPAFLRFIETEVVPFVQARWRVGPTRILYGESYGGLFVIDALARGRGAFTDYIAVSPTVGVWPDGLAAALRQRLLARPAPALRGEDAWRRRSSLFIVYGERDAPLVTQYAPAIVRLIETARPPALRLGVDIVPRVGHDPPESLERGLRFVFSGDS
jgi:hypothetical protein